MVKFYTHYHCFEKTPASEIRMEYMLHGTNVTRYSRAVYAGVPVFSDSVILDEISASEPTLVADGHEYCKFHLTFHTMPALEIVPDHETLPVAIVRSMQTHTLEHARSAASCLSTAGWIVSISVDCENSRRKQLLECYRDGTGTAVPSKQ